ncbi:MAG TPA: metallophosphoesterase [Thermomicrobiales bacterium]|nr:metallophosphoesterase [Thermomicrobiales bacterium]
MKTTPYRLAFLADIHANLHALEAVLAAIHRDAPDLVVVGGDLTYRFPFPRETLELLATVEHRAIAGNTERYVTRWAAPGAWPDFLPAHGAAHAAWTRERIGDAWADYLAALPPDLALSVAGEDDMLVVHGVPGNPFVGIHAPPGPENRHPDWAMPDDVLAGHLAGVHARLILAGHTHIPLVRRWGDSLIVNPGAVGYTWPTVPDPHLARYALLTHRPSRGWEVALRAVPYDTAAAIRALRETDAGNARAGRFIALLGGPGG